jgi:hypothetical protein
MRCYRCGMLLFAVAGVLSALAGAQSQSLVVKRHGDQLQLAAPQMHFLEGKALDTLHNGSTMTYVFNLSVNIENEDTPAVQIEEQFAISFDLWEEKYSIVRLGSNGLAVSHMSAVAAEAWCLDNIQIPLQSVPTKASFTLRLECSVDENDDEEGEKNGPLTLAGLIDVFSRKKSQKPLRWEATAGPLKLSDLEIVN